MSNLIYVARMLNSVTGIDRPPFLTSLRSPGFLTSICSAGGRIILTYGLCKCRHFRRWHRVPGQVLSLTGIEE